MEITHLVAMAAFIAPFVFVYQLLCKIQAGDRSGRNEPTKTYGGGDVSCGC